MLRPILIGHGDVVNLADELIVFSRTLEDTERFLNTTTHPFDEDPDAVFMRNLRRRSPRLFCKFYESASWT